MECEQAKLSTKSLSIFPDRVEAHEIFRGECDVVFYLSRRCAAMKGVLNLVVVLWIHPTIFDDFKKLILSQQVGYHHPFCYPLGIEQIAAENHHFVFFFQSS